MAEPLPKVLADPIQIEQVLVNLVYNALEAMGEDPATGAGLTLETKLLDQGMVEVCVIDDDRGRRMEALRPSAGSAELAALRVLRSGLKYPSLTLRLLLTHGRVQIPMSRRPAHSDA